MNSSQVSKNIRKSLENSYAICTSGKYVWKCDGHKNKEGGCNDTIPKIINDKPVGIDFLTLERKYFLPYYTKNKFRLLENEGTDLVEARKYDAIWDFYPNRESIHRARDIMDAYVPGNHERKLPKVQHESLSCINFVDAIRIYSPRGDLIGTGLHGREADDWNAGGFKTRLVNWAVRYGWAEYQNKHSASSNLDLGNAVENSLCEFGDNAGQLMEKDYIILAGHTHNAKLYKNGRCIYANGGCWINPNGGHCIELEHEKIQLVRWDFQGNRIIEKEMNLA
jgi:hypothetical protein